MKLIGGSKSWILGLVASLIFSHIFAETHGNQVYPELYDNSLPRYPGAVLVNTGRQISSLRDGIRLKLTTVDSVKDVSSYYEARLRNNGWVAPEQRFPIDTIYMGRFMKQSLVYQLRVTRLNPNTKETQIEITYMENK